MKKKTVSIPQRIERKVLGVTANLKNAMITIALLFGFIGGFFQIYNWVDTTYAKVKWVKGIELNQKLEKENGLLNSMYQRYCTLDNMFLLSPDPTKIDPELRKEWLELKGNGGKGKIKLQEEKVKLLEQQLLSSGSGK